MLYEVITTRVNGIVDINTILDHNQILGTAQYSAPEYFIGEVGSPRSDLYSLGVIVYQMLSGKFPYGPHVARSTNKTSQKKLTYESLYSEVFV